MNKTSIIALIAVLAVVGLFLFKKSSSPEVQATLTGTVAYLERIALLEGSVVEVEIRDVSLADAPSERIAGTSITTSGENVPIPFSIDYDPARIDPARTYSIFARILVEDQLRWITDEHVSFLVDGAPRDTVELVLTGVSPSAPSEPSQPVASVSGLSGKTFRLSSYNGSTIPEDVNYTLNFDGNRLGAKFCNNMGGEYTLSNGFIRVSQMVSTLMYCASPNNVMGFENSFSTILAGGAALSYVGSSLVIADANNTMVFMEFAN